jgi:hypothetical protein
MVALDTLAGPHSRRAPASSPVPPPSIPCPLSRRDGRWAFSLSVTWRLSGTPSRCSVRSALRRPRDRFGHAAVVAPLAGCDSLAAVVAPDRSAPLANVCSRDLTTLGPGDAIETAVARMRESVPGVPTQHPNDESRSVMIPTRRPSWVTNTSPMFPSRIARAASGTKSAASRAAGGAVIRSPTVLAMSSPSSVPST